MKLSLFLILLIPFCKEKYEVYEKTNLLIAEDIPVYDLVDYEFKAKGKWLKK